MTDLPFIAAPSIALSPQTAGNSSMISAAFTDAFADILARVEPRGEIASPGDANRFLPEGGKSLPVPLAGDPLPEMTMTGETGCAAVDQVAAESGEAKTEPAPPPTARVPADPFASLPAPTEPRDKAAEPARGGADCGLRRASPHLSPLPLPKGSNRPEAMAEQSAPAPGFGGGGHTALLTLAVEVVCGPAATAAAPAIIGPDFAPAQSAGSISLPSHGPTPHRAMDFAAIVERIAASREAEDHRPISITVRNQDFGPIAMRFEPTEQGLAVTASSADPAFARAISAATPAERGAWQGEAESNGQHQQAAQHDQPRKAPTWPQPARPESKDRGRTADETPHAPAPAGGTSGLYA